MTAPIGSLVSPAGPLAWALVGLLGIGVGRAVTAGVDLALAGRFSPGADAGLPPLRGMTRRIIHGTALVAAFATWWWELRQADALPAGLEPDHAQAACRGLAHALLFALLAAAAIVDFRHRVIPDIVTVPGVVLGLVGAFLTPDALPPIIVSLPRTFAAPLDVPDVLGVAGGLHAVDLPAWLGPRTVSGLAICLAIWGCWWVACTAPFRGDRPLAGFRWFHEPRNVVLVAGGLLLCGAWWQGGDRWAAVVTAIVGLAVGGGMIWGIRAAASWAMGREAMGMGDVTLMAMIGTWLGWQPCMLVLYCTVFVGLGHAIVHLVRRGETEFPFGPSLCLAAVLVVVFWRPLWARAGGLLEDPALIAILAAFVIGGSAGSLWMLRVVRERNAARR